MNFKKKNIVNLIGLPSLIEIYFLLKECKLFIGNDSGLMHLAAVCGIPTIGLFGPSDKYQYHPWGEKILALSTPETPESLMNIKENFSHKNSANLMKTLTVKDNIKYNKFLKNVMRYRLSILVIAKNEEKQIANCLETLNLVMK